MARQHVGTMAWVRDTGGRLSLRDRMALLRHALMPGMGGMLRTWLRLDQASTLTLAMIPQPDTPAIRSAYAELQGCASETVVHHSLRTYYWGAALGHLSGVDYDPEMLMTSCLLHDLGMTESHHGKHPGCHCFAVDGAVAARDWAQRFGWPEARQEQLAEAISLHLNGHVGLENGAEAHLLQQGAACDVVGARYFEISGGYRADILERHPRFGLNQYFCDFIARESAMRPDSRTNFVRHMGFTQFIQASPFED